MITKHIFTILLIAHTLGMHIFINGMESEDESIEEQKPFYRDDTENRSGIYHDEITDNQKKKLSDTAKENIQDLFEETKNFTGNLMQTVNDLNTLASNKVAHVYFPGFGEYCNPEYGLVFPDCPLEFSKAAFYTKPNVIIAAQYLKSKIEEGYTVFHLEGKSAGAGILINCLDVLTNYKEDFFANTSITKTDAENIMAAVNKGKIALSTPLLSMEKTCIVAFASQCASYTTILFMCGLSAYNKWLFAEWLRNNSRDKNVQIFAFFAASILMINLFGHTLENMFSKAIDRYIIPKITRENYDPNYKKPIEAVKDLDLKSLLTCPILIHCSRNDEILVNDQTMTQFYCKFNERFSFYKNGKQVETYFLLSDDDTHDKNNLHYKEVSDNFFNLNQEAFTTYHLKKQYSISNTFKDKTLLLHDNSRVAKEIADLKRNPIDEFFSLGYSVYKTFGRLLR